MNDSKRTANDYPAIPLGADRASLTPRQNRVRQIARVDLSPEVYGKAMVTLLVKNDSAYKEVSMNLTPKEQFLLHELFLDFLEARRN